MLVWSVLAILVLVILLTAFFAIARKGRELRRLAPLPPAAKHAYLRWNEDGKNIEVEVFPPFYFGNDSESNVRLQSARTKFEACIFHHKERFAIQTLDGGWGVEVNGEEVLAGYLRDGDVIKIGKEEFYFRCV